MMRIQKKRRHDLTVKYGNKLNDYFTFAIDGDIRVSEIEEQANG